MINKLELNKLELKKEVIQKFNAISNVLDERALRLWAATESRAIGFGGDIIVSTATGMARQTIRNGRNEIDAKIDLLGRVRKKGGGRHSLISNQPGLEDALEKLVDPVTRGNPMSPLKWTCKSRAKLSEALAKDGWKVSTTSIGRLLNKLGYRLQSVQKRNEGSAQHPDRDAQFEYINKTADNYLSEGQPIISVDTKKKELIGDFKNNGREYHPTGEPETALTHDFPQDSIGKAVPYGVYDMGKNEAWVSVGKSHDTPQFAVASIRQWWKSMGKKLYPNAHSLFITADAGGSNGYRCHLWKFELQKLSDEINLKIRVSHFPPGTSKWNKIEHRLFCHITQNWRGKPLRTFETIVELIANTKTKKGLRVRAKLDNKEYLTGITVTKEQLATISIHRDDFQGQWNYEIHPRKNLAMLF